MTIPNALEEYGWREWGAMITIVNRDNTDMAYCTVEAWDAAEAREYLTELAREMCYDDGNDGDDATYRVEDIRAV